MPPQRSAASETRASQLQPLAMVAQRSEIAAAVSPQEYVSASLVSMRP